MGGEGIQSFYGRVSFQIHLKTLMEVAEKAKSGKFNAFSSLYTEQPSFFLARAFGAREVFVYALLGWYAKNESFVSYFCKVTSLKGKIPEK